MEKSYKKIIVEISRIFLGIVFIFSGFVKAVDPWGGAYKIIDYFTAFELSAFNFSAVPLSFIQAAIEFAVGVCLLIGVYRRLNSILALLIMLFMTPLTLYLAIANPVSDCGCFGDALVISNWQTFYKNIFLLAAAVFVFLWNKYMTNFFSEKRNFSVTLWIYIFVFGLSFYCFHYLPVVDFRPYRIGSNIPQKMTFPENAEHDKYDITLIYADKEGNQKEFTLQNYPKNDDSWTFVDQKSKLIKKGYTPPIHDFSITNADGFVITQDILINPSYTFLLVAQKLEKANDANVDKINDIFDFSKNRGFDFYCLTASLSSDIQHWIENTGAEYPFCSVDEITLKTIIRSNPGLVLIKNGNVINMWPNTRLPDTNILDKLINDTNEGKTSTVNNLLTILILALVLFIPVKVLFLYDFVTSKKRKSINN